MPDFSSKRNPDGTYELRTPSGEVFPEDPRDQRHSDFLRWLSMRPAPHGLEFEGDPAPDTYYFGDMDQLVEHLKKWQSLLYVCSRSQGGVGEIKRLSFSAG